MRSVQNTRKITRTMELVPTSKLKRAQDRGGRRRPYAAGAGARSSPTWCTPELAGAASRCPAARLPRQGRSHARAAVLLITSNRGLAGGFNANLIKEARQRIEAARGPGATRS